MAAGSSDGKVWLWDVATSRATASLPHPGPVTSVAFPADDATVGTGAADGIVRVWQIPGPTVTNLSGDIFSISFPTGTSTMAVTSADNTAGLVNVAEPRSPAPLGPLITNATRSGRASGAAVISPDGRTLAVGAVDGGIQLWDVANPAATTPLARITGPAGAIEGLMFSPDGKTLAAGSDDHNVWLWDVSNPAEPTGPPSLLTDHTNYAYGPAFSNDGRLLAAGGADNTVRLWDAADPRHPQTLALIKGHTNYVFATAFSPDGHILASAGADNTVRLWDVTNPTAVKPLGRPLTGPNNYVYSLAFDPTGRTVAAGAGDGQVWLWDLTNTQRPNFLAALAAYGGPVFVVAFDPAGILAAGGDQGTVRLWNTSPDAVAKHVCSTSGQPITPTEWRKYTGDAPYRSPC
ncbi:WD40 repeat domain-containing protein [Micromonospora sp. CPCC 206061]|uniref:WD40 repeat domain-containing protein n=1 Tax=Micromonospora sp. CPCC 206061 TaxID=3122410 RepID=UPI002FF0C5D8